MTRGIITVPPVAWPKIRLPLYSFKYAPYQNTCTIIHCSTLPELQGGREIFQRGKGFSVSKLVKLQQPQRIVSPTQPPGLFISASASGGEGVDFRHIAVGQAEVEQPRVRLALVRRPRLGDHRAPLLQRPPQQHLRRRHGLACWDRCQSRLPSSIRDFVD